MDPLTSAAGTGVTRLFDYGLAVTVIALVGICCVFLIRYLLQRCDQRFDQSLQQHVQTTREMSDVVKQNTAAYTENAAALRELKETFKDSWGR